LPHSIPQWKKEDVTVFIRQLFYFCLPPSPLPLPSCRRRRGVSVSQIRLLLPLLVTGGSVFVVAFGDWWWYYPHRLRWVVWECQCTVGYYGY